MNQTIIGVFVGISTSFIAGILLIWKGDQFVRHLKNLPTKRRILLFTRVYLRALHAYPYRYLHYFAWVMLMFIIIATFFAYVALTYAVFTVGPAGPEAVRKAVHISLIDPLALTVFRWALVGFTILIGAWLIPHFYRIFSAEILVPYACKDLERLRQCVGKCSSPEQFIAYADAENEARTLEDLKNLFRQAKAIIGAHKGSFADEMLLSLGEAKKEENDTQPTRDLPAPAS